MFWKPSPQLYPPYLRSRIRKGKGIGEGTLYKPWLTVEEVPSKGTSSCVKGIRIPRDYHLLSELETTYFFLLERRPEVVDVREQWPILDVSETLRICADLGVRHKYRGIYPEPATIDFLITEQVDGVVRYRAASIKTPKDAGKASVRQRLAVEHTWCEGRGIPWSLVDTSRFTKDLLSNLRFMRGWFRSHVDANDVVIEEFARVFLKAYSQSETLNSILCSTSKILNLDPSETLDMLRYCAWKNRISVSLVHPIALNRPLVLLRE